MSLFRSVCFPASFPPTCVIIIPTILHATRIGMMKQAKREYTHSSQTPLSLLSSRRFREKGIVSFSSTDVWRQTEQIAAHVEEFVIFNSFHYSAVKHKLHKLPSCVYNKYCKHTETDKKWVHEVIANSIWPRLSAQILRESCIEWEEKYEISGFTFIRVIGRYFTELL